MAKSISIVDNRDSEGKWHWTELELSGRIKLCAGSIIYSLAFDNSMQTEISADIAAGHESMGTSHGSQVMITGAAAELLLYERSYLLWLRKIQPL